MTTAATDHVDVLIIGAGLSGIGAAAQVRQHLPGKSVAIWESRGQLGGTWDLFKYPGIRSDSDMFTFGYKWRPWPGDRALADGHMILDYLTKVAREYGVDKVINYGHRVTSADFDRASNRWTVTAATPEGEKTVTASVLWSCAGYYDYEGGHQPEFPGLADFEGTFIHPQHWPEDLDYEGKKVVVIGSGATAVTLVPAMSLGEGAAEHVTMLQRTPTYILSRPGRDPLARALAGTVGKIPGFVPFKGLRDKVGTEAVRWAAIMTLVGSYQLSRRKPGVIKKLVHDSAVKQLTARDGGPGYTPEEAEKIVEKHFTPPYEPWDQRLCVVPDGDLFKALREKRADVVTDRIKTFTPKGIELESGETLEADIVVSATGLKVQLFGGIDYRVDGKSVNLPDTMSYKAALLSGLPNFVYTIGYTNASWTLKADLVSDFAVRLLRHMDQRGFSRFEVDRDPGVAELPFMDLASGYIQRALDKMPKQGDRVPWRLKQNYLVDLKTMSGKVDDDVITFS